MGKAKTGLKKKKLSDSVSFKGSIDEDNKSSSEGYDINKIDHQDLSSLSGMSVPSENKFDARKIFDEVREII